MQGPLLMQMILMSQYVENQKCTFFNILPINFSFSFIKGPLILLRNSANGQKSARISMHLNSFSDSVSKILDMVTRIYSWTTAIVSTAPFGVNFITQCLR